MKPLQAAGRFTLRILRLPMFWLVLVARCLWDFRDGIPESDLGMIVVASILTAGIVALVFDRPLPEVGRAALRILRLPQFWFGSVVLCLWRFRHGIPESGVTGEVIYSVVLAGVLAWYVDRFMPDLAHGKSGTSH